MEFIDQFIFGYPTNDTECESDDINETWTHIPIWCETHYPNPPYRFYMDLKSNYKISELEFYFAIRTKLSANTIGIYIGTNMIKSENYEATLRDIGFDGKKSIRVTNIKTLAHVYAPFSPFKRIKM
jgi:hypothetical protein